jgi:pimeloyl-ACP methyl ester carboxylesterase
MDAIAEAAGTNRPAGWHEWAIQSRPLFLKSSSVATTKETSMSDTYVLVHGAWHTGAEIEAVADGLRAAGHTVHCPTLAGNNPGDDRSRIGLEDAIESAVRYIEEKNLTQVRLVGHSYGGMVISGVADRIAPRLKRLVYINAFVPLDGESLNDMVPPHYVTLFDAVAEANGNGAKPSSTTPTSRRPPPPTPSSTRIRTAPSPTRSG